MGISYNGDLSLCLLFFFFFVGLLENEEEGIDVDMTEKKKMALKKIEEEKNADLDS